MINKIESIDKKLTKLSEDIEIIKKILMSEGKLNNWAVKELKEAREIPDKEYVDLEDAKKEIL